MPRTLSFATAETLVGRFLRIPTNYWEAGDKAVFGSDDKAAEGESAALIESEGRMATHFEVTVDHPDWMQLHTCQISFQHAQKHLMEEDYEPESESLGIVENGATQDSSTTRTQEDVAMPDTSTARVTQEDATPDVSATRAQEDATMLDTSATCITQEDVTPDASPTQVLAPRLQPQ